MVQPGRVEDVDVLIREAIQYSWGSIFVVYNYYLHVVPRLVTIFSLYLFGISNVNLAMNIAAIIIATLCALFFSDKQFRFIIKNDLLRAFCSLFIIVAPGMSEIYSNISSIQWFLNIFTMLFTMMLLFRYEEYQKKSKKKKYLYTFFCSVSFLSSAFSIVFLPALIYVIIREIKKNRREIITIFSYAIPTIILLLQTLILYTSYSQQFKSTIVQFNPDIIRSTIQLFSTSVMKIFYYNIVQYSGELIYLIPIALIAFILINSIKTGLRLEIFVLYCITATLFFSAIVRGGMVERFMSFTIVFLFILVVRQFDKKKSLLFRLIFLVVMIIVITNIVLGFLIPSSIDENWKYVANLYDPSGNYQCYVGETHQGWQIFIPCFKSSLNNITESMISSSSSSASSDHAITFTPPVVPTNTTITSSSTSTTSGLPVTFTATIAPTPDYGSVQFFIDDIPIGKSITILGGQSVFSISSMSVGVHHVYASFSGAPNFYASTSDQITIKVLSTSNLKGTNLSDTNGCNDCP
ncbi:MAG TPA: Ig-like domain-containing protein [Candidatus Nitrosotalea sp.]|nr:Ig-like domain-containing protein [Candidatus Nitrosotalea sp.]